MAMNTVGNKTHRCAKSVLGQEKIATQLPPIVDSYEDTHRTVNHGDL